MLLERTLTARTATIDVLLNHDGLVSKYLDPLPSKRAFRAFLKRNAVPSVKPNPAARRGGGVPYYHVASIERILRARCGTEEGGSK
jgi:hypothetical protein